MVPPTGAPKAAHAAPLIQTRGAACRNHLSQASQKNNQRNRKTNDHNRANCHNVVCNKVSILEFMPRHPHLCLSQTYWLAVDRESGDADL